MSLWMQVAVGVFLGVIFSVLVIASSRKIWDTLNIPALSRLLFWVVVWGFVGLALREIEVTRRLLDVIGFELYPDAQVANTQIAMFSICFGLIAFALFALVHTWYFSRQEARELAGTVTAKHGSSTATGKHRGQRETAAEDRSSTRHGSSTE